MTLATIKTSLLLPQNLILLVYYDSPNLIVIRRCTTVYHKPELIPESELDQNSTQTFDNKQINKARSAPISQTIKLEHDIISVDFANSNLFVLLKNGDLQKFVIQPNQYRNWCNYPTTLVTSLIPHGWEVLCSALKSSYLHLLAHVKSSDPIGIEADNDQLDGWEFTGKPLVFIAIGTRRKKTAGDDENRCYRDEIRKEPKPIAYDSQLVLHSFSLNDDALINSKILATEIIPCSLHFTRSYLVLLPTEEHFDRLLMFRKYTISAANKARNGPSFGSVSLVEKNMHIWSANHGIVKSSKSDHETISVQQSYTEVLDCLGNVETLTKIVEVQTQHCNNEIFVVDAENKLFRIDLERPTQITLRALPGYQMIGKLKGSWKQLLPYHGKQVMISYPSLVTSIFYDTWELPRQFSVKLVDPILPNWVTDGVNEGMTRLLRVFQDAPTANELVVINLDIENRSTKIHKTKETTDLSEDLKGVDYVVTRIGEDIIKDHSLMDMMRNFVHSNPTFFHENEGDLDSSVEAGVQIERKSSKSEPTTKDQISELVFDISSNPRQRYFKLIQLSELHIEESLDALFGMVGYKESPVCSLDELVIFSREPSHLKMLLVQSENNIFNQSATRLKQDLILPIFEQTCRLIIKRGNGLTSGRNFVKFVANLIGKSEISLFERPSQDFMMKRFMNVWNELAHLKTKASEKPPVDLFLHENMEVSDMTHTLQAFFEDSSLKTSTGQNLTVGDLLQKIKNDDCNFTQETPN